MDITGTCPLRRRYRAAANTDAKRAALAASAHGGIEGIVKKAAAGEAGGGHAAQAAQRILHRFFGGMVFGRQNLTHHHRVFISIAACVKVAVAYGIVGSAPPVAGRDVAAAAYHSASAGCCKRVSPGLNKVSDISSAHQLLALKATLQPGLHRHAARCFYHLRHQRTPVRLPLLALRRV